MLTISLSPYIVTVVASLVIAQGVKYIVAAMRTGGLSGWRQLYASGSMPSAHSASVIGLLVMIGLRDGTDSGLFGLSLLLSIIVMYDAIMVRRSVGEQGGVIQKLIEVTKSALPLPHSAKGHTPLELLTGALVGVAVSLVVFFATK